MTACLISSKVSYTSRRCCLRLANREFDYKKNVASNATRHPANNYISKLTIDAIEQEVKYVQS